MAIGPLIGLVGLALYLGLTSILSVGDAADGGPGAGPDAAEVVALAPAETAAAGAGAPAPPARQDGDAAIETVALPPPPCRELLLPAGEYLSHTLERWVRACLDKPSIWAVGSHGTYLDYELTDTRRVALARGFASLQEHLRRHWSVYAVEDETRVIFDDELRE